MPGGSGDSRTSRPLAALAAALGVGIVIDGGFGHQGALASVPPLVLKGTAGKLQSRVSYPWFAACDG